MGGLLTTDLKAELYKCSTPEFPQEYAVVYTSLENDSAWPSVFRVSVNRDRVLCRVADYLNKDSPVRLHTLFTAERDSNGNRKFGEVRVVSDGTSEDTREHQNALCSCEFSENGARPYGHYEVERMNQYTWEVRHIYSISMRTRLESRVKIQCDKVKGLCVEFGGPFKYKEHLTSDDEHFGSPNEREVKGEPPKAVKALIETEFKGEAYTLFPSGKGNTTVSVSVQATGIINNVGNHYHGNNNGAVNKFYYGCKFNGAS